MPLYKYIAKRSDGQDATGIREADDVSAVVSYLRSQGLMIVRIDEEKPKKGLFTKPAATAKRKKIKLDDIVVFSRQVATMVDAGIPLVYSLKTLADQMENFNLKVIVKDISENVESGKSFSEALRKHTKVFSPLFINMVRAGESSGTLDEILDRLATYMEKTSTLQKKIKSAMIYPIVVTLLATVITGLMFTFVIPKFAEIFDSLDAKLPTPTVILINISNIVKNNILYLLGGVFIVSVTFNRFIKTKYGRLWFDSLKLKLPLFGPLILQAAISKFSRTLSTLIKSGVPILTALEIVGATAGNVKIQNMIDDVRLSIREGENIATPLAKTRIFPPMVVRMIAVGEESGELEKMTAKIADFYEAQVDAAIEGLSSLIEPMIIAFLGVVIGGIVIAMFLPILTLTQALK